jgi:signal transduction histidine kinase
MGRVDPKAEDALVAVAEEALGSAMRHSTATLIRIALVREGGARQLDASDGFDTAILGPNASGSGLRTLTVRMADRGGALVVQSAPGP